MIDAKSFEFAETLWAKGSSFRQGAQVLFREAAELAAKDDRYEDDRIIHSGPLSVSIYVLLGTAFELMLKAAYILHGGNPSPHYLRKQIGHDLEIALQKAQQKGFDKEIPKLTFALKYLSPPYKLHHFRYQSPGTIDVPDIEVSLGALDLLEKELAQQFSELTMRK